MRVRDVDLAEYVIERPQMLNGCSTMGHDNQGTLAAQVVYQQLEEGVNRKSFVNIPNRIEEGGGGERDHTRPGGDRVDGNHEEDADDIALEQGLAIIFGLKPNGSTKRKSRRWLAFSGKRGVFGRRSMGE